MKIQKILKRLLQLHPKSVDLSLNRIKRLLKDLNNPEKKIKNVIQVVGTNGKHSFCSALREIFETAGYTVNLNVSPSLRRFNERYYLSGKYISDDQLHDLLIEVEKIMDVSSKLIVNRSALKTNIDNIEKIINPSLPRALHTQGAYTYIKKNDL